jgi:hypothetical protein
VPVESRSSSSALLLLAVSCLLAEHGHGDVRFSDVTVAAGIDFTHASGAGGRKYMNETVGSGGAFLDYDSDGDLDIYLLNGAAVPGHPLAMAPTNALYRNSGDGHFDDVTKAVSAGDTGYAMGCTVGDIDNDGDLDLYVTNFGANVLYRNDDGGDGRHFADIGEQAGVDDDRWGSGCAFADVDADGFVDLYVATYTDFSYDGHRVCREGGGDLQLYCGPEAYGGVSDVLFRNLGGGAFDDITVAAGLDQSVGKELGVLFGDVDVDGDVDLYLASDQTQNFLFLNNGQGRFDEQSLYAGTAYSEDGEAEGGMGVHLGDYDTDGWPDLFVSNFQWETNTLYRSLGDGRYRDVTGAAGLGRTSLAYLGWGTRLFDVDNDGDLDLFVANGHPERDIALYQNATFAQRNQLFVNDGLGRFREVTDVAGTALSVVAVSRGAAFGDYDDDGDVDILVTNCEGPPTLMRNDGAGPDNWLRVRLEGTASNRAAIGARVELVSGSLQLQDQVLGGSSYLSQSDLRLHFGLGSRDVVDVLRVYWPSGHVDELPEIATNQEVLIIERSK